MNIAQLMKQAQAMQKKMEEMQLKMAEAEVTGTSGGNMVSIVLNGKGDAKKLTIDPSLIKSEDKEILEDLIVAAINDAKNKIESESSNEMSKMTAGLNLPPGFKLPF